MGRRIPIVALATSGLLVLLGQLVYALADYADFGRDPMDDNGGAAPVLVLWLLVASAGAVVAVIAASGGRSSLLRSTGVYGFLLLLVVLSVGHGSWPMFVGMGLVVLAAIGGHTLRDR